MDQTYRYASLGDNHCVATLRETIYFVSIARLIYHMARAIKEGKTVYYNGEQM